MNYAGFFKATCIIINLNNSIISMCGITEQEQGYFSHLFPYQEIELDEGLDYLGFHLKPNLYYKGDCWLQSGKETKYLVPSMAL
jgi:hypothetical protein